MGQGKKKEKRILFILTISILAFLTVAWFLLKRLETYFPVTEYERAAATAAHKTLFEEETEAPVKAVGSVKLNKKTYCYYHQIESYLFLGTDYTGNGHSGTGDYVGDMADFLTLLVIDRTDKKYSVLQLNRDTMTKVRLIQKNGEGRATATQQLCTAHWYGGNVKHSDRNTLETVEKLLGGIKINGYYTLSMEYIPEINKAVGGVEVTIEDDFSDADPSLEKGKTLTLTDEQAVHYIHDRMNVGDGENTSRMRRQKLYMEKWYEKALRKLKEEPNWVNSLYREFMEISSTNLKGRDISKIVNRISSYSSEGIKTIDGTVKLGKALGDGLEHTEFYLSQDSLVSVMKELYSLTE